MAAFVKSVERVSAELRFSNGFVEDIALSKGQDVAKCAVVNVTARARSNTSNQRTNNMHAAYVFDDAGTPTVRVSKEDNGSSDYDVQVDVVEFGDNVTVQYGIEQPLTIGQRRSFWISI